MLTENTLFILGAGASKSLSDNIPEKNKSLKYRKNKLDENEDDVWAAFGAGYREMPLGYELVDKLADFKHDASSGFLLFTLLQIFSRGAKYDNNSYYDRLYLKKFLKIYSEYNTAKLKTFVLDLVKAKGPIIVGTYKREALDNIEEFFTKKITEIGGFGSWEIFVIFMNFLAMKILYKSNLNLPLDKKIECKNIYQIIDGINAELFGSELLQCLTKSSVINIYKNGKTEITPVYAEICSAFKDVTLRAKRILSKKIHCGRVGANLGWLLSEINLSPFVGEESALNKQCGDLIKFSQEDWSERILDEEGLVKLGDRLRSFDDFIEKNAYNSQEAKKHIAQYKSQITQVLDKGFAQIDFIKNFSTKDEATRIDNIKKAQNYCLKTFLISHMLGSYLVTSIDNFIMNLEHYTAYEAIHRKGDEKFPDSADLKNYAKYLVACVILEDSYAVKRLSRMVRSYVRDISEMVINGCENDDENLDKSLSNLNVINFNYDTTFVSFLREFIPSESLNRWVAKQESCNIHPYGALLFNDLKNNTKDDLDVRIWDKFFKNLNFNYEIDGS